MYIKMICILYSQFCICTRSYYQVKVSCYYSILCKPENEWLCNLRHFVIRDCYRRSLPEKSVWVLIPGEVLRELFPAVKRNKSQDCNQLLSISWSFTNLQEYQFSVRELWIVETKMYFQDNSLFAVPAECSHCEVSLPLYCVGRSLMQCVLPSQLISFVYSV